MASSQLTKRYRVIQKTLASRAQQQVLRFRDELEPKQQQGLLDQLESLDFAHLDKLIKSHVLTKPDKFVPEDIAPAPFYPQKPGKDQQELYSRARQAGIAAIAQGKVAAVTVAGGQGTRLGFDGPKGAFCISPVKNKPLFQILAESVLANQRLYQQQITWYIMTSPTNDRQIRSFFEQNEYFGLPNDCVRFFTQGTIPTFGYDGKLLLASRGSLAVSPNGHGGTLSALRDSGCLEQMKKDGVEYLSYVQVDNPLVHVFDPLFIGLHVVTGSEISSKTLPKIDDLERVGNFCLSQGKLMVIEYSDLPAEFAHAHNPDGSRTFNTASIALHIISVDFIDRLTSEGMSLPFHRADKKVPCIDQEGLLIEPTESNAVKMEMFIFDALPLAKEAIIFETDRAEEFSPIKNAVGSDSPLTCRRDMVRRAARWMSLAGIEIPRNPQGEPACTLEISPLFALDAQQFLAKKTKLPTIDMGEKVYIE